MGEISRFGQAPPTRVFTTQLGGDNARNSADQTFFGTLADAISRTSKPQTTNQDVFIKRPENT